MEVVAAASVLVWLTLLSGYDIRQRRLPNWLTLPAAVLVPAVAAGVGRGPAALAGAATLAGVYLVVHLIDPAGLGAGDVKLAVALGALTGSFGADVWLLAAVSAPLLTGLCGLGVAMAGRGRAVPHGPSMCLASAVAAVLGMS
ncbi:prepilin peptidase [Mycobacterium sp. SMC-14]|uniref:prepilin peptidase n=1 Tax=Mycobacterium sp. SMC-14 TaxID=3385968 RepID=UPI00390C829B